MNVIFKEYNIIHFHLHHSPSIEVIEGISFIVNRYSILGEKKPAINYYLNKLALTMYVKYLFFPLLPIKKMKNAVICDEHFQCQ